LKTVNYLTVFNGVGEVLPEPVQERGIEMPRLRLLLYGAAFALFTLLPAAASAHPATGIVVDAQGRIHFSDLETVWRLDAGGRLTIFRPAVRGRHVHELSTDKDGNVYGGDVTYEPSTGKWIEAVWSRSPDGREETYLVAPAADPPRGVSIWRDAEGNTYHVEQDRHTNRETLILKRTPRGEVLTLAGGTYGQADGRGTQARFRAIGGMTFGGDGSLYVTDAGDVRRVWPDGEVRTLAKGLEGLFPDDKQVGYGGLMGLAVDAGGNVYVADYGRRRVLKVAADGKVSRVVSSDAPWSPTGVAMTREGRVLILEVGFAPPNVYSGPRVRELSPDGTLRVLATVGLKQNVAARLTSSCDTGAKTESDIADLYESNVERVERALGLYFVLGVVAIGAVAGLKGFARRTGHA
jgi:sugar lactone lactonase YvrE